MITDILKIHNDNVNTANLAARSFTQISELRKKALASMFDNYYITTHKLVEIATIRGVHFIDDSASTNINKTWFAIENVGLPVIWIMNSDTEMDNLASIIDTVSNRVRIIINYGQTYNARIFQNAVKTIIDAPNLASAVRVAFMYAAEGDAVVFSPSIGSAEDITSNARVFINAVNEL
ncbi:MAG: hypothetical protein LBO06_00110 [Bacteroidales bacterium]|jgi:UDP-N-acetylmuramoylalanine--D-glutamate ligase|nr:hypothetical protein [Bacteroidales bacterium]